MKTICVCCVFIKIDFKVEKENNKYFEVYKF